MSLPADYNLTWYKDATTGHTHDLAAHMSADTFGTLNVTTAGIASFSSDVRTLGSFQSTVSPTVKAQFDTTLSPAITIAGHDKALLYVYGWKGFVFVAETTVSGSSAIYLFSNNGVFLVSAAGPFWEAPTTTPTNLSIAQNPTAANSFYIYNNNASSVTVHVQAFSGA
jgi:hypothetical protein